MRRHRMAALLVVGLTVASGTAGCSRAAPLADDILRIGARVAERVPAPVGELTPSLRTRILAEAKALFESEQWADAKEAAGIVKTLSQTEPICSLTIDEVFGTDPAEIRAEFLQLAIVHGGDADAGSLHDSAVRMAEEFDGPAVDSSALETRAVIVEAFKNAYCG